MNTIRSILLLAVLSLAPLFGQVTTSVATPPALSKGDAVLDFILKKAEKYSGSIEEGISQAVDFAKEQTPLAVAEWLKWKSYEAIWKIMYPAFLTVFLGSIAYWGGIKRLRSVIAGSDMYHTDKEFCGGFTWIASLAAIIIPTIVTLCAIYNHLPTLIQIHVAPRVYLIEEAMKLVHK